MPYELWTYQDAIDRLLDGYEKFGDRRGLRNVRRAIQDAYRELATVHEWSYFRRRLKLTTSATQTDGTIAYDHTGGASERLVTLTGATWPSSVEFYELYVDGVRYEIDERLSSTTLTLTADANPGEDLASGTSYTLLRSTYPLPTNFSAIGHVVDVTASGVVLGGMTQEDWLLATRMGIVTGTPFAYSVVQLAERSGAMALAFHPCPTDARTYDALIRVRPLPLVVERYYTGTVALTAGDATVTGTGTSWDSSHVGCVLRVGGDGSASIPTSQYGDPDGDINPAVFEGIVRSVTDATHLELEEAPTSSYASRKYTLSSRLDLEAGAMLDYFFSLADYKMASVEHREDAGRLWAASRQSLRQAIGADRRLIGMDWGMSGEATASLADMAAEIDYGDYNSP